MKKRLLCLILALNTVLTGCSLKNSTSKFEEKETEIKSTESIYNKKLDLLEETPITKDIVISVVGDCTLGTDPNFGYERTFTDIFDQTGGDYSYFFSGVYDILSKDDLTIANLETTFTDATIKADKKFNFKGPASYAKILKEGSVEAVNIANNHIYDYLEKGYTDTKETLSKEEILYFGYNDYCIYEINGIRVGLAGFEGWNEQKTKDNTKKAIDYFKDQKTNIIIITYHWGTEYEYKQNTTQENIAKYAIDNGADMIIGHHPHILQGIECYKGKYIFYSLGNFVFGGNKNPKDKDTLIAQLTFHLENNKMTETNLNLIPCSLSSETERNDYKPIVLEGNEKERVLKKIIHSSTNFDY